MKALRRKDTKQFVSKIGKGGELQHGELPQQVSDKIVSTTQIEEWYKQFTDTIVDLSNHEIVEVMIVEKSEYDLIFDFYQGHSVAARLKRYWNVSLENMYNL